MKYFIKYLKKKFNKGLLLKIPKKNSVVSDLFIWRNDKNWQTFFELFNLKSIFNKDLDEEEIKLDIRNPNGQTIVEKTLKIKKLQKERICISDFLVNFPDYKYGTFSIYHENVDLLDKFKSFVSERGYTLYKYNDINVYSYVHGNLDAISYNNGKKELLGEQLFFNKYFNIQYKFENIYNYDLSFVNPTKKNLILNIYLIDNKNKMKSIKLDIHPAGSKIVKMKKNENIERIKIKSKYLMSRPLIFEFDENFLNAFHS